MDPNTASSAVSSAGHRGWEAEYAELAALDRSGGLQPPEMERLAVAAYLTGRDTESLEILTRAHNAAIAAADGPAAARTAVRAAFVLLAGGERSRAAGWTARARRVLDEAGVDCVECGFVMLPVAMQQAGTGDLAGAARTFGDAERIGVKFGDRDLIALARQGRGRALAALGHTDEGVSLFDEVMTGVVAGEVSPIVAGVVYCSVITACFDIFDVRRAREWTNALNQWCAGHADVVPYRGQCRAYRADILRMNGRWADALEEARNACEALAAAKPPARGSAWYAVAELRRLSGDLEAAEDAFQLASEHGANPLPGLALLRLAQGRTDLARAAIVRALDEPAGGRHRPALLAAAVEVLTACGDLEAAGRAANELREIAAAIGTAYLRALSDAAEAAVRLAGGDPRGAMTPLRQAVGIWEDLGVPYEAARARVLIGSACLALGDVDGAQMEWNAAGAAFRDCGAALDLGRVEARARSLAAAPHRSLTDRETEVLRLVARGATNREIARALAISEKTVARHLSNIFVKLDVATRAAATAYAFKNQLVR